MGRGNWQVRGTGASGKKIDCSEYQSQNKIERIYCSKNYAPVCGTDFNTYGNKCILCTRILEGDKIDVAHEGECVDCFKYPPPPKGCAGDCPKAYIPVCGTDGETYVHTCILCAKIWSTGVPIGIRHKGQCISQG
ncbi:ovomucoid-like isoform X2 [Rhineura floridana]|uniref:ovomucoid-like isoform X2 n=1 Tax=Rhineura floridana TaxID=261503 RepID=UPI002AC85B61|nr:ovomucoid-like isoform X2 [Rhineura floridana]